MENKPLAALQIRYDLESNPSTLIIRQLSQLKPTPWNLNRDLNTYRDLFANPESISSPFMLPQPDLDLLYLFLDSLSNDQISNLYTSRFRHRPVYGQRIYLLTLNESTSQRLRLNSHQPPEIRTRLIQNSQN